MVQHFEYYSEWKDFNLKAKVKRIKSKSYYLKDIPKTGIDESTPFVFEGFDFDTSGARVGHFSRNVTTRYYFEGNQQIQSLTELHVYRLLEGYSPDTTFFHWVETDSCINFYTSLETKRKDSLLLRSSYFIDSNSRISSIQYYTHYYNIQKPGARYGFSYDHLGRVTEARCVSGDSQYNVTHKMIYNANGFVTQMNDRSKFTNGVFTPSTIYELDKWGNVTYVKFDGVRVEFVYDECYNWIEAQITDSDGYSKIIFRTIEYY